MSILIVDDHDENIYLLESILKGSGHAVQTAANGAEALEKLKAGDVELIISDILIPVMDGFQLCRKVKTDEALRHMPFIIYTATYTSSQDEAFAMKIGADRFILKPCEPEVFMKAVEDVMAAAGRSDSALTPEPAKEHEILKLYNERLVRKLEQKMLQAEGEIQARQKAEEALRISNTRLRLALASADIGLWDWNLATNEVWFSPEWKRQIGCDDHEIPNRYEEWEKRLHPKDHPHILAEIDAYLQGRRPGYQVEFRLRHKDGTYRWISASGKLIAGTDKKSKRFMGCHVDITAHLQLEAQLFQAQKMESVGRLAGGVAHDYNNMLGVILGYGELALDKVKPGEPLYEDLEKILEAARRSRDITRQLLAFARKETIAPEILDLNATVESMLKMIRRLIGEDIDLAWLPGAGLWPVRMDPSQVDQSLANLCVNARDAIANVGRITIETDNVTIDKDYCSDHAGFVPGDYVMLAVSDTGSGIAPEDLDKIFEPFFTTKGLGKGTGLGLATVYGIVKQNDGFINVYSETGNGTTIRIYLPRHSGQVDEADLESTLEIPSSRGETILLVEDDGSILELSRRILVSLGYTLLTATTPGEAMALAKGHSGRIHLLITDVVMPEMNGRELSKQLQVLYPDLKILFISGYTANVIAHRGVLEKGVYFLPKPFSKKDLAVKVRQVLDTAKA
jgi:two-component system cell cycle sensor histidine kinase/response regulator CckA